MGCNIQSWDTATHDLILAKLPEIAAVEPCNCGSDLHEHP